ncbi:hypothetical protein ElyMa_000097200 [Elysia marginata]|uniref:Uncharacterized protein n=1 Tax=Elysia marginata TaxID=1093978 RepID=A0AAV4EK32_9GAST|nr:hypothetical protein ElyMa_000097200 [Elysia marginata]
MATMYSPHVGPNFGDPPLTHTPHLPVSLTHCFPSPDGLSHAHKHTFFTSALFDSPFRLFGVSNPPTSVLSPFLFCFSAPPPLPHPTPFITLTWHQGRQQLSSIPDGKLVVQK